MMRRYLPLALLGGLVCGVATTPLFVVAAPPLAHNLPRPGEADTRPVIRWIFREADMASCSTPAYTLRHLQNRLGDSVDVVAVGVGVDESAALGMLRSERLAVSFVKISEADLRTRFPGALLSGIYVTVADRVIQAYPTGTTLGFPEPDRLVRSILPLLPAATRAPSTHQPAEGRPS